MFIRISILFLENFDSDTHMDYVQHSATAWSIKHTFHDFTGNFLEVLSGQSIVARDFLLEVQFRLLENGVHLLLQSALQEVHDESSEKEFTE